MPTSPEKMWNDRYAEKDYAYGELPNEFLKEQVERLSPGKILLPADGEGRNGVFAAKLGWDVTCCDISIEGQKKAFKLADKNNVSINYEVGDFGDLSFEPNSFDAVALIYAHFPPHLRKTYHQKALSLLKPGGVLILEGFSKNHLPYREKNPKVGGPNVLEMLFSIDELKSDFVAGIFSSLEEKVIQLSEGIYHVGDGSVVRAIITKED